MTPTRIAQVLGGQVAVGSKVTIEGWVRTRRDSKAGLSFLAIHDGSSFEALQIVAPQELANYQSDVLRITSGCAVRAAGELVASQGKGQAVELRGWRAAEGPVPASPMSCHRTPRQGLPSR